MSPSLGAAGEPRFISKNYSLLPEKKTGINYAYNKPTRQVSTFNGGHSGYAVDGVANTTGFYRYSQIMALFYIRVKKKCSLSTNRFTEFY